jgi:hypothetical protein
MLTRIFLYKFYLKSVMYKRCNNYKHGSLIISLLLNKYENIIKKYLCIIYMSDTIIALLNKKNKYRNVIKNQEDEISHAKN